MRDESPLTGLPGNGRAQEEIETRVVSGQEFALLLTDLDHFKAFNDHYGFPRGDEVIQSVANLLVEVAAEFAGEDAFVAHLGGDDFAMLIPPASASMVADTVVQRFDEQAPSFFTGEDAERCWIEVLNRRGEPQRYGPITISIGVASTQRRRFAHFAEAIAVATEMRGYTKGTGASSWSVDRRANA
jgi:diguanylate cyclase (GGDEF)-like protein